MLPLKSRQALADALRNATGNEEVANDVMAIIPAHESALPVTREYLRVEMAEFRNELGNELRTEFRAELGALRAELRGEMGALRTEVGGAMGALRAELRGEMGVLRKELLDEMRTGRRWSIATVIAAVGVAVGASADIGVFASLLS